MKQKKAGWLSSNNNIDIIYSSIPDYSIIRSIDFVRLSNIHPRHEKIIYDFLEGNGFRVVYDKQVPEGNYYMKRKYKSYTDSASVEIMHGIKDLLHGHPTLLLYIHDPNRERLSLLDSFFRRQGISPKVSLVELTFDFFTDDRVELREFLVSHLFLKNKRTGRSTTYASTFYTNDIRRSSKGMRVYPKGFKGDVKKMVRMELVLNRSIIRRLGLEFPLSNIDAVDLSKFFSFKFLNLERIKDYMYWRHRHRIEEAEKRNKRYGSGLVKAGIRTFVSPYRWEESLMDKVDLLKLFNGVIPNYSRFLESLDQFNSDFFDMAPHKSFI